MSKQFQLGGITVQISDAQMEQIRNISGQAAQTVEGLRAQGEVKMTEFLGTLVKQHPETAMKVMALFTKQSTPSCW